MSCPQIWNIEKEKDREKVSRRQASEAQREKGQQSAKARREILLEEQPENIIAEVRTWEMLAATAVEMSGSEKKTHEHVRHFLHKK